MRSAKQTPQRDHASDKYTTHLFGPFRMILRDYTAAHLIIKEATNPILSAPIRNRRIREETR